MMKLSTMWRVDRTVGEGGRSPLVERLLERWEHDPGSARFYRSSANSVFGFKRHGEPHFLRFAGSDERTRRAIEGEVDLLHWLVGAGLRVACPVPSTAGRSVESVPTAWGTYHAVVFAALDGDHLDLATLGDAGCRAWGAALGRLHAVMGAYRGPALEARETWQERLREATRWLAGDEPRVVAEVDRVATRLRALPDDDTRFGLIHGDFELDNLCWREGAPGVLDFDDCVRSWYVADIGAALRPVYGDLGDTIDLEAAPLRAFVRGYVAEHPLDDRLLARLPDFRRLLNLTIHARLVRAVDLPDDPGQPQWLRALRRKLTLRMKAYRAWLRRQDDLQPRHQR